MHVCLNVDEIVRAIACELVTSKGRGTAVAFACCCKSFEDPVLDALWRTHGAIFTLLKTLPEDVYRSRRAVSVPMTCVFSFLNCSA